MIPETERMWLRPVRLKDAEFPQPEIVKHLGAVVPWPYPPDGARTFSKVAQMEGDEACHWILRLKTQPERTVVRRVVGPSLHLRERRPRP